MRLAGASKTVWARWVFVPLLVTGPPVILFAAYDYGLTSSQDAPDFAQQALVWLEQHKFTVLMFAAIWLYLGVVVRDVIERCAQSQEVLNSKAMYSLFDILEEVVGEKASRFRKTSISNDSGRAPGNMSAENIFREITQPDQQIALLTHAIRKFFITIADSNADFKVTLAEIDDSGKPSGWMFYAPESDPPRTPLDVLKNDNSAIRRAVQKRDLVVVEDIAAEAMKGSSGNYACADPANINEEGALIAYPVLDPQSQKEVPYVITVTVNQRRWFTAGNDPIYVWALKRFAIRLRLEHYLLQLRAKADCNLEK